MSFTISNQELEKWIPKKYKHMIQEVNQDPEVWEVLLYEDYMNTEYGETMWIFGKHHVGDDGDIWTKKAIKEDLQLWLYFVEKKV